MDHRQHHPLASAPIVNLIQRHLPLPKDDHPRYTEALIYFSQISQAMATKVETETYRVGRIGLANTMGALYWQLNDVWVAPSWSSIDFKGNFKILQYWAKEFFAPIHVVAHLDAMNDVNVYVVSDVIGETRPIVATMKVYSWSNLIPAVQRSWTIDKVRTIPFNLYNLALNAFNFRLKIPLRLLINSALKTT